MVLILIYRVIMPLQATGQTEQARYHCKSYGLIYTDLQSMTSVQCLLSLYTLWSCFTADYAEVVMTKMGAQTYRTITSEVTD